MSKDGISRREFMKRAAALGLSAYGLSRLGVFGAAEAGASAEAASGPTLVVASNRPAAELVRAAVQGLGGMQRFVSRGDSVLVKPNIAWARRPEQGATTSPEIVAEVVRLCLQAGASQVKVMDHAVDRPDALLLRMTGIGPAAEAAGATVRMASSQAMYQSMSLPRGRVLRSAEVLRDLQRADVFINVPIAKVHGSTGLTLGCKNLMGVVWDRGAWHGSESLDQCLADFAAHVRPDLVILDALRTLMSNGPKGPGRLEEHNMVVAGSDPLAVDAFGATLFNRRADQVEHLTRAHALGVGEIDLERVRIQRV